MWSDNDTAVDFLDYAYLVGAVEGIVKNDELIPCTIGLFGDWGSGKSSLMRMVENSIEKDKEVLVVKFNGWLFEGYDEAKSVLMATILEEVEKRMRLIPNLSKKAKGLFMKLIKRVNWIKTIRATAKYAFAATLGGPAGVAIAGGSDFLEKALNIDPEEYFKEKSPDDEKEDNVRMGIKQFHDDFQELLNDTNIKRLVVFIDDLDRCRPDTIIDVLEAIKLFLYVKGSAFVLAADERIIRYAVRDRFKDIDDKGAIETDYLEKLIQFPIRIPQLDSHEIETYINLLFAKLNITDSEKFETLRRTVLELRKKDLFSVPFNLETAEKLLGSVTSEFSEALVLSAQITPILASGLKGNPRQAKRFLNTLLLRISMAKSQAITLERKVLAKLMLIEYLKPESFQKLFEIQIAQEGRPKELAILEDIANNSEKKYKDEEVALSLWLSDSKLHAWLKMTPHLSSIDLRSYFYFSRDKMFLTSLGGERLSNFAKELLSRLLNDSKTVVKSALGDLNQLPQSDAAALFLRIRGIFESSEGPKERKAKFDLMVRFADMRKELIGEFLQFVEKLPSNTLFSEYVEALNGIVSGTTYEPGFKRMLQNWSKNSENELIAKTASSILKKK